MAPLTKAKYDKLYKDPKACFGKMYDEAEQECKKCGNGSACQEYLKNDGSAGVDSAPAPTAKDKPVKKTTGKKTVAPPVKGKPEKKAPVKPAVEKKTSGGGRQRDGNGFVIGSKSAKIYDMIKAGKSTKDQMLASLEKEYPGANNKTTLSVFIGDVQREKGKYSCSRGITIVDTKGVLSIK